MKGKFPAEPAGLATSTKRLEGICSQYGVADQFHITSNEDDDNGCVEVTRPEAACQDKITRFFRY